MPREAAKPGIPSVVNCQVCQKSGKIPVPSPGKPSQGFFNGRICSFEVPVGGRNGIFGLCVYVWPVARIPLLASVNFRRFVMGTLADLCFLFRSFEKGTWLHVLVPSAV